MPTVFPDRQRPKPWRSFFTYPIRPCDARGFCFLPTFLFLGDFAGEHLFSSGLFLADFYPRYPQVFPSISQV